MPATLDRPKNTIEQDIVEQDTVERPAYDYDFENGQPSSGSNETKVLRAALVGVLALTVVGVVAWFVDWQALWDGAGSVMTSPESFRNWVEGFGVWAPAAFFLAEALQVIAAPVPGSIFPPIGAAAFGPLPALVLSLGGTVTGSVVVFVLGRKWGRPMVGKLVGPDNLDKYSGIATSRGGLWLFLVFLLPLLPDDVICALAGISRISLRRFVVLNVLGRLPGTFIAVYAMSDLLHQPLQVWIGVGLFLAVVFGVAARYRKQWEKWVLNRARDE